MVGVVGNILSSVSSVWNEDTYHNTLETVVVTAKKPSQTGKKTILERIGEGVNTFFGQIKLPEVQTNVDLDKSTKTMVYVGLALVAFLVLKKK